MGNNCFLLVFYFFVFLFCKEKQAIWELLLLKDKKLIKTFPNLCLFSSSTEEICIVSEELVLIVYGGTKGDGVGQFCAKLFCQNFEHTKQ